jgi:orotate phosphoribosyltransferase
LTNSEIVAESLLKINAVTLSPNKPFTWASGMKAPIYTDNRITISYPAVRKAIYTGLAQLIRDHFPEAEVVAGTATAGIPHAAWVAQQLKLPLIYVRKQPKDHGRGKMIEGILEPDQQVVVVDDLISTGGSVLKAVKAVREAGGNVVGVVSIFTYQLPAADTNFGAAGIKYYSVTNYTELINLAMKQHQISSADLEVLKQWRDSPLLWSKEQAGK